MTTSTVVIIVIALIIIPPLRLLLKNCVGGLELLAISFDDSMKTGAASVLDSNEEQRRLLIERRQLRGKVITADELLLQYLKN